MYRISSPKVIHETIDGETILLNLDNGTYYTLEGVGAEVWSLIERGFSEGDIIEDIVRRYAGPCNDMANAIRHFADELQREGLISVSESEERADAGSGDEHGFQSREESIVFVAPVLHRYTDMQDVLLLDPIHDADEAGWPSPKKN